MRPCLLLLILLSISLAYAKPPKLPDTIYSIMADIYVDNAGYRDSSSTDYDLADSINTESQVFINKQMSMQYYSILLNNVDSIIPLPESQSFIKNNPYAICLNILECKIPSDHCGIYIGIKKNKCNLGYLTFPNKAITYNIYFTKKFSEILNNIVKKEIISIKNHIN